MGGFDFGGTVRFAWVLPIASLGCDGDKPPGKGDPIAVDRIGISASTVMVGFQAGKLRKSSRLQGFHITPLPITANQYQACIKARVCPAIETAEPLDASEVEAPAAKSVEEVALGVSVEGAKDFCNWVGGTLPTLPQWLLAARGSSPQRFAWGEHLPTCDEHPGGVNVPAFQAADERGRAVERTRAAASYEPCGTSVSSRFAVDQHSAGTSANGLKDVLLASSELLAKDTDSIFGSCRGSKGFCKVFGSAPGAIDFVRDAESADDVANSLQVASPAFAFRCVWSKGGDR
jgi:hypothetical protein